MTKLIASLVISSSALVSNVTHAAVRATATVWSGSPLVQCIQSEIVRQFGFAAAQYVYLDTHPGVPSPELVAHVMFIGFLRPNTLSGVPLSVSLVSKNAQKWSSDRRANGEITISVEGLESAAPIKSYDPAYAGGTLNLQTCL